MPARGSWLPALAWAALIWVLCASTDPLGLPRDPWLRYLQELAHAVLFGVQAALLLHALRPEPVRVGLVRAPPDQAGAAARAAVPRRGPWIAAALGALAYGAFVEWWQGRVPGRVASGYDLLSDAVGAFGLLWIVAGGRLLGPRTVPVALAALLAAWLAWSG